MTLPIRKSLCLLLGLSLLPAPLVRAATTPGSYQGVVGAVPIADGYALPDARLRIHVHNLSGASLVVTSARGGRGLGRFALSRKAVQPGAQQGLAELRFQSEQLPYWARHHTTAQFAEGDAQNPLDGGYDLRPGSDFHIGLALVEPGGRRIALALQGEARSYSGFRLAQYLGTAATGGTAGVLAFLRFKAGAQERLQTAQHDEEIGALREFRAIRRNHSSNIWTSSEVNLYQSVYRTADYRGIIDGLSPADKMAFFESIRKVKLDDVCGRAKQSFGPKGYTKQLEDGFKAEIARLTEQDILEAIGIFPGEAEQALEEVLIKRAPPAGLSAAAQQERVAMVQRFNVEQEKVLSRLPQVQALRKTFPARYPQMVWRASMGSFFRAAAVGLSVAGLVYGAVEIGHAIHEAYDEKQGRARVPAQSNQSINLSLRVSGVPGARTGFDDVNHALATTRTVHGSEGSYLVGLLTQELRYLSFYSADRPAGAPADERPGASGVLSLFVMPLPSAARSCRGLAIGAEGGRTVLRGECIDGRGVYQATWLDLGACAPPRDVTNAQGRLACREPAAAAAGAASPASPM